MYQPRLPSGRRLRGLRLLPVVALLALAALLPAVASARSSSDAATGPHAVAALPADVAPAQVPAELKAAIRSYVEGKGLVYAGLCKEIAQDGSQLGKQCANVLELSDTQAKVSYGAVASDQLTTVNFEKQGGAWRVADGSSQVPAELKAAIKAYIEGKGLAYAGLCKEIAQDGSNLGKQCANVLQFDATTARVAYAAVATDQFTTVNFEKRNGAWVAAGTGAPKPPATGSGTAGEGDGDSTTETVVLGLLGATAVLLIGGAIFGRRNVDW